MRAETPWLSIVGIGEDGLDGLSRASRDALAHAELVTGSARHLALLPGLAARTVGGDAGGTAVRIVEWPVPFADGLPLLLAERGRRVVVLVSGDPFWFGAGSRLARELPAHEWRALPAPSAFSLAAARLGWSLQSTPCFGLHAAPFTRLRPHLVPGRRALVLVRDGGAVHALAHWLAETGFGATRLSVLEALGGPRERARRATAAGFALDGIRHPVAVGLVCAGDGATVPCTAGRPDALFEHDGQLTRRPIRALTLSALAPRPGERLWDVGAGSGSISIEWLLAHPDNEAVAIEASPERAARARANADRLGADRLDVVAGRAPEALEGLPEPAAVFIGGGLSEALLTALWERTREGCRIVANAVTLEGQALLSQRHATHGGELLRIDRAEAAPLGGKRGWHAAYSLVQWSATR